ncbi:hypothetical protein, partial [Ruthenibacterium lactatiformans]|uniref:hypothetical protein n=1 Tax=Ruthenibacterium lactatiformans TaxID=1550024 RepID=UPI0027BA4718
VLELTDSDVLESAGSDVLELVDSDALEFVDSDVLELTDSDVLESAGSDVLELTDSDVMELTEFSFFRTTSSSCKKDSNSPSTSPETSVKKIFRCVSFEPSANAGICRIPSKTTIIPIDNSFFIIISSPLNLKLFHFYLLYRFEIV